MAVSLFASLEVLGGGFLFHGLFGFRPASRALASTFAVLEVEANLWNRISIQTARSFSISAMS